jgi:hypothetical protein
MTVSGIYDFQSFFFLGWSNFKYLLRIKNGDKFSLCANFCWILQMSFLCVELRIISDFGYSGR